MNPGSVCEALSAKGSNAVISSNPRMAILAWGLSPHQTCALTWFATLIRSDGSKVLCDEWRSETAPRHERDTQATFGQRPMQCSPYAHRR
jgi:hypothetical protein